MINFDTIKRNGADRFLSQFLDTNGDESGTINQAVNGSITPVEFKITPPADKLYALKVFQIEISTLTAIDSILQYGDLAPLANGILLKVMTGSGTATVKDFSRSPIRDNADLFFLGLNATDAGNRNDPNAAVGTVDLERFFDSPIRLDGSLGEELIVTIQDDLSGLVSQEMNVTGRLFDLS